MSTSYKKIFKNAEAMQQFAAACAPLFINGSYFYLSGELGVGKTTFIRGLLHGLGHHGRVKSPTYTIVEIYELNHLQVFHFDLFRIQHETELSELGFEEYFQPNNLCLIEWPINGAGWLPVPDIDSEFSFLGEDRQIAFKAKTERGRSILSLIQQK